MQLFVDSGDRREVLRWDRCGVVDGVTTNPTILRDQDWDDLHQGIADLARLIEPRPISVEVYAEAADEMVQQARIFAGWADNIVIKVPIVGPSGQSYLEVVHELQAHGIRVNCTACMSFSQVMLAAKAGATYASLLVGRIDDEGGDGAEVVRRACSWLDAWGYPTRVIAGSIRGVTDAQRLAVAGVHIITIPPSILKKLTSHHYSQATAAQFQRDAQRGFVLDLEPGMELASKARR